MSQSSSPSLVAHGQRSWPRQLHAAGALGACCAWSSTAAPRVSSMTDESPRASTGDTSEFRWRTLNASMNPPPRSMNRSMDKRTHAAATTHRSTHTRTTNVLSFDTKSGCAAAAHRRAELGQRGLQQRHANLDSTLLRRLAVDIGCPAQQRRQRTVHAHPLRAQRQLHGRSG